ncbi:MAG: tyrosine-protein phosphatase [Desulfurispora sp.]|uniref:tyrosine-protein phosphatase n=1 Tax=Desulfurispora sp. TaxID=3014275 RepID=UPI00404AA0E9
MFIDIHCHILPGLDDGPGTMADAVAMAALAVADGVVTVVATPHVYPGLYENTPQSIEAVRAQLQAELQQAGLQLEVRIGAEYFLEPGILGRLVEDDVLFLNRESRSLLVEFPAQQVPAYAESLFYELFLAGCRPVIAHPERNPELVNADLLERLVHRGALLQLTAASLTGQMGRSVQKAAEELLARGIVHLVASDAHSCRGRTPQLSAAAQKVAAIGGESIARRLFYENPRRLLKGEDVAAVRLPGAGRAPGSWWRKVLGIVK